MTPRARARIAAPIVAACVLPSTAAWAHGSDRLGEIRASGVLVVGVKTDYPPFGMLGGDTGHQGFEVDLAADLARRLDVSLSTISVSATNRLQVLDEGRADVTIATLGDTAERRNIATLIEPDYYASGAALMTRADSTIKTWADVRGATICATQGSYFNHEIAKRYLLDLEVYANGRDAKLAVRDGRCAGWLFDNTAIEGDLHLPAWRDYRLALPPQLSTPWAIAIARRERGTALDRFIGDTVADWHRQGFLLELERKWKLPPSPFLADMHRLWTARDEAGRYVCTRAADGRWPVACRNPAFVTSTDVTGLRRWGLAFAERTGIDLTYVYDDYERRQFLHALALTLGLTISCVAGALACALVWTLLAAAPIPMAGAVLRTLALLARTTPPLLQIYVLTFGVGSLLAARWHLHPSGFWIVVASLSAYTGAGIMRTLEDAARHERAHEPGLRIGPATLGRLLRRSLPSVTAFLVNVTKATMMASAVAVPELLSVSTSIIAEHGNVATMMNTLMIVFAGLVWLVLSLLRSIATRGRHVAG
jgi:polar amino acid transport system substrate-binding protein